MKIFNLLLSIGKFVYVLGFYPNIAYANVFYKQQLIIIYLLCFYTVLVKIMKSRASQCACVQCQW